MKDSDSLIITGIILAILAGLLSLGLHAKWWNECRQQDGAYIRSYVGYECVAKR